MPPSVDVIIPNYNKAEFLDACLESLRAQSWPHWRAVVVDGHSDDGSWELLQRYAADDARFELHQAARTGNLYSAWNFGLERVSAPYFCVLTSDDVWPRDWLAAAVASLEGEAGVVCAAARTIEVDRLGRPGATAPNTVLGERFYGTAGAGAERRDGTSHLLASYFLGSIYTSVHALVVRRTVIDRGLRFAEDLGSVADVEWCMRLGLYGDVVYHPAVAVGWRRYDGQASSAARQRRNGAAIRRAHERNRRAIADASPALGEHFIRVAARYDDTVLAYDAGRPCLANLRARPLGEGARLAWTVLRYPALLAADLLGHIGKTRLAFERGLATASGLRGRVPLPTRVAGTPADR